MLSKKVRLETVSGRFGTDLFRVSAIPRRSANEGKNLEKGDALSGRLPL